MVWNFIMEWENFNLQQLAVMSYNLGLAYFIWDVAKFVINQVIGKLGRGRKRWN